MRKGFTLLELIIVIIVIGVLASLALPGFGKARESALEKEAQANLRLISAAEKIYHMEYNAYFTGTDLVVINNNLKLSLPAQNWSYAITSAAPGTAFTAQATRGAKELCINETEVDPYTCP